MLTDYLSGINLGSVLCATLILVGIVILLYFIVNWLFPYEENPSVDSEGQTNYRNQIVNILIRYLVFISILIVMKFLKWKGLILNIMRV